MSRTFYISASLLVISCGGRQRAPTHQVVREEVEGVPLVRTIGDAKDFLKLTGEEEQLIEMKLALASTPRHERKRSGLTKAQLAVLMESSQSRVAKMEAGDPSVSLDLLVRALLILGMSSRQVGDSLRTP